MNEPRAFQSSEDWGVVFQSVPSKNKNEVAKRIEEIFGLGKQDAKQILSNVPLILIDSLSFGLAARIKSYFQKIGVTVEVTNHDIIKKNCSYVSWPQTPDLSFFIKLAGPATMPTQEEKNKAMPSGLPVGRKPESPEMKPEAQKHFEAPLPARPVHESPAFKPLPAQPSTSNVDPNSEGRVKEIEEQLRKLREENQSLRVQHAEAIGHAKKEFQQKIEDEKKKSEEIVKTYEELQREVKRREALPSESEDLRSRAAMLDGKVRELEISLKEKTSEVEHFIQEKETLIRQAEKAAEEAHRELVSLRGHGPELSGKIEGLERTAQEMTEALRSRDSALAQSEKRAVELEALVKEKVAEIELLVQQKEDVIRQSEKAVTEARQELAILRGRELELSGKIEQLERTVQKMTESLRSRDGVLALFEERITKLIEMTFPATKKTEPDAKLPEPTPFQESVDQRQKTVDLPAASFSESESKKQKPVDLKKDVPDEGRRTEHDAKKSQDKIVYIIRGNSRNLMEWHRVGNTEEERRAFEKKHGRGLTIEGVIAKLTGAGWSITHKDEEAITFSRQEKPFNPFMKVVGSSLKTVHVTFPLR